MGKPGTLTALGTQQTGRRPKQNTNPQTHRKPK